MKLADYVIQRLADEGIDKMFVVYGAANGDLIDAFTRVKDTEYVAVMHEQAGGFAAEGYAKVKGVPGVSIATSGPGGMNLLTPMGNCFYDSVPCVFLTGQINTRFLRPDPAIRQIGFQETDIVAMATPVTKYAVMVRDPAMIRYHLEKALHLATSGRPGPVLLDIPMDVQKAQIEPDRLPGYTAHEPVGTYMGEVLELISDLERAKRPALLIGGGVRSRGAIRALDVLAAELGIPMFPTWNALDVVTSDNEFYGGRIGTYGGAGRNFGIQNADILIAVGCRISGRITGGQPHTFARGAKKYVVDVDQALLERQWQQVPADVNVFCDAEVFLGQLAYVWKNRAHGQRWRGWMQQVTQWRLAYDPVKPEHFAGLNVHPYAFMRALSDLMPDNAIIVTDCGGNVVTANHAFETKRGQRFFSNNGNSPMGFSFAGAMGAWFANPRRPVVCIIGDGGMNMNIQELQTLKNYGAAVKTFILNNHIYGITKMYQETNFDGRCEACGPKGYKPPNFLAIASAYGVHTTHLHRQSKAARIAQVIEETLAYEGPVVCDVDIDEFHTYEPRISGWNTPIEDMAPQLPRAEFRNNMIIEPLPGWENGKYDANAGREHPKVEEGYGNSEKQGRSTDSGQTVDDASPVLGLRSDAVEVAG